MSSAVISEVGPQDVDEVVGLFAAYLVFYGVQCDRDAVHDYLAARVRARQSLVLCARARGGSLVGFVQVYPGFSSLSLAAVWTLNDLYVAPSARCTGVGRLLVREVCRRAGAAGAVRVDLATAEGNRGAQALYEAEGFRVERGVRHYSRAVDAPETAPATGGG